MIESNGAFEMTDSDPSKTSLPPMSDHGLNHCALECRNLDRSIDFYAQFGGFEVVHRRSGVAWISDRTRPFALVLVKTDVVRPIGPFAHLGFACGSRAEFDRLIEVARSNGVLRDGPNGGEGPAGTWAFLDDPDGNTFELSVGQSAKVTTSQKTGTMVYVSVLLLRDFFFPSCSRAYFEGRPLQVSKSGR